MRPRQLALLALVKIILHRWKIWRPMSVGDLRENALPTDELPGCRRLVIKGGARILTQVGLISEYIYGIIQHIFYFQISIGDWEFDYLLRDLDSSCWRPHNFFNNVVNIQSFGNGHFGKDDHQIHHPIIAINIANIKQMPDFPLMHSLKTLQKRTDVVFPLRFFWRACSTIAKQLQISFFIYQLKF